VAGLTVVDPESATVPMPLSMETLVALVVLHVNVEELPTVMLVGAAVSFAVGGLACTVTVAAEVAVPFTLVAVNVYSVVDDGETGMDPEEATTPMPLLIVTVEAYAVVHDNVAELPGATVAGEAVRVAVGTTGGIAGSKPAPRQPDIKPAEMQAAITNKRFMAKYTLHHPYEDSTVLASKNTCTKRTRKSDYVPLSQQGLRWVSSDSQLRCLPVHARCLHSGRLSPSCLPGSNQLDDLRRSGNIIGAVEVCGHGNVGSDMEIPAHRKAVPIENNGIALIVLGIEQD